MRKLTSYLLRLLWGEEGPTAVEYAVMLALIIAGCMTAISSLGSRSRDTFDQILPSQNSTAQNGNGQNGNGNANGQNGSGNGQNGNGNGQTGAGS